LLVSYRPLFANKWRIINLDRLNYKISIENLKNEFYKHLENMFKSFNISAIYLVILFLCYLFTIYACENKKKESVAIKQVTYYPDTKSIKNIIFVSPSLDIDSSITFSLKGDTIRREYFIKGKLRETIKYKNNRWFYRKFESDSCVYYDNNRRITKIRNEKDSSITYFYLNNRIKKKQKYYWETIYYTNEYDSATGQLTSSYRYIDMTFDITDDSLIMEPYLMNKADRLENYTFILVEYDEGGVVKKTYYQKPIKSSHLFSIIF